MPGKHLILMLILVGAAFAISDIHGNASFSEQLPLINNWVQTYDENVNANSQLSLLDDGEITVDLYTEKGPVTFGSEVAQGSIVKVNERAANPHTMVHTSTAMTRWIFTQKDPYAALASQWGRGIKVEGLTFGSQVKVFFTGLALWVSTVPASIGLDAQDRGWMDTAPTYIVNANGTIPAGGTGALNASNASLAVPMLVNVLKNASVKEESMDAEGPSLFTQDQLKKRLEDAFKRANEILAQCDVQVSYSSGNIVWDATDPDGTPDGDMDRNANQKTMDKISDSADAELKKKFGTGANGTKKGFKLYIVDELLNSGEGERGTGVFTPPPNGKPGYSILMADATNNGRLLAHEIAHGLGCLDDSSAPGSLMQPFGGKDDAALTDAQCKQIRACAAKRK